MVDFYMEQYFRLTLHETTQAIDSMSSVVSLCIAILFITGCVFSKCLSSCAIVVTPTQLYMIFYMEQYFRLAIHETTQADRMSSAVSLYTLQQYSS